MNQELQDYIKKTRETGFNDEQIKQELLKVGWKAEDINQEFSRSKSRSKLFMVIAIAIIAIFLIGSGVWYFIENKPIECTQEAKLCSDGSYVGRTGPKCEFAECPIVEDETANWKTYTNMGYVYEIKYPVDWYVYTSNPEDVFIQETKEEADNIPGPHADAFEVKISVSKGQSLNKIIEDQGAQAGIKYNISNVKIGEIDGIKAVSICDGVGCGAPEWMLIENGILYHFKSNLGYSVIFDQILSTFKFIE